MKLEKQQEITKIAQEFSEPFYEMFGNINDGGWLIVDPLSGYLNSIGFKNKLDQIPENETHPQVLIMTFEGGDIFIPCGKDLKVVHPSFENWQWI